MEKMTRKEQAQATRARLYSCALELFAQKDFDSVTISDICRAAKVSVGNFYHYFSSKASIFQQFSQQMESQLMDNIANSPPSTSHRDAIIQFFMCIVHSRLEMGPALIKNLSMIANQPDIESNGISPMDNLDICVKSGQEAGEITTKWTAQEISSYLMTGFWGLDMKWYTTDGDMDLEAETKKYLTIALDGLMVKK